LKLETPTELIEVKRCCPKMIAWMFPSSPFDNVPVLLISGVVEILPVEIDVEVPPNRRLREVVPAMRDA
jgi:hypothetical protein